MARILIANDEVDFLESCRDVLRGAGHTVRAVASGALALQLALQWHPDLVLVDWKMPDMDGTTAIRALRGDPLTASLPILMMSGSERGPEAALQAGADGFLRKPFEPDELTDQVDQLLAAASLPGAPS